MGAITSYKGNFMDKKRISISAKRQITIPSKFFEMLGFTDEAECYVKNNEIIIRPVQQSSGGEFAQQILEDLVSQGLEGDALIAAFKEQQSKIRPAVETMISEAEAIALGNAEYETYEDVFGSEE